jgi:ABC-type sulfate/molybdate transport systems ATPase subunit
MRPGLLSCGQQRVALARLLASRLAIALLYEPFSARDSHLQWRMEREMIAALDAFRGTMLMVSHNRNELYLCAGVFACLAEGIWMLLAGAKMCFTTRERSRPRCLQAARTSASRGGWRNTAYTRWIGAGAANGAGGTP